MFGLVNLNKPVGWTSRDALNRVEGLVRPVKAGHAGTLDPLATGVLVVCIGPATRLIEYIQRMPKQYRATFLLGRRSASDDLETDVEAVANAPIPTVDEVSAALPRFVGRIEQRPPAFSAVKVDGRRAYQLARRGVALDVSPRTVQVHQLAVARYEYPELELLIRCSGGTYVRSVGRDIADALGTHAVMSALVRTAVGSFSVEDAINPRGMNKERLGIALISPRAAVAELPTMVLTPEQVVHVQRGGLVAAEEIEACLGQPAPAETAVVNETGALIAVLKEARPGLFKPSPNFLQTE
jgi:tRNA pseudouridine55 synthase